MNLNPPATPKEQEDLKLAIAHNIPPEMFDSTWFNIWANRIIAARRGYQTRFYSEAYNEDASSS